MSELNPRQKKFIKYYLLSGNASDAYRKAGYKSKNANVDGPALLANPVIQAEIKKGQKKAEAKLEAVFEITQDMIIKELAAVAFGSMSRLATWNDSGLSIKDSADLSEDDKKFVENVQRTEMKMGRGEDSTTTTIIQLKTLSAHKVKALELLGKQIGMWKEKDAGSGDLENSRKDAVRRLSEIVQRTKK